MATSPNMMDGLNNNDKMSVVKLSVVGTPKGPNVAKQNRYAVTLRLEFFHQVDAKSFQPKVGAVCQGEQVWETVVFVKDVTKFQENVAWKGNDTQAQWDRYRRQLELM